MITGGTGSRVRPVVACKGTVCTYGIYDTQKLAKKIHDRFYTGYYDVKLPHKFKIAVGGCPNNCVKPDLNDFGIMGQRVPAFDEDQCSGCKKCAVEAACPIHAAKLSDGVLAIDREICNNCGLCVGKCPFDAVEEDMTGYKVFIGGRWGKYVRKGSLLSKVFTEDELLNVLEKTILFYREQGKTGERFGATIDRLGLDVVEANILSDEILERKEEILDAKLHLVGGATC